MNIIEIVVIFTIYRYLDMSIRSTHTWSSMPLAFCIFYICNIIKDRRSAMTIESHLKKVNVRIRVVVVVMIV
jgi:hypothetical protein